MMLSGFLNCLNFLLLGEKGTFKRPFAISERHERNKKAPCITYLRDYRGLSFALKLFVLLEIILPSAAVLRHFLH